jgi:hypothetical protein
VKRIFLFVLCVWNWLGAQIEPCTAHPIAYQGAVSAMSMNSSHTNELFLHYTFHPRFSMGAKVFRFQERGQESLSVFPQASVLLFRWNHPNFQANVYSYGGFGGSWSRDQHGTSVFYGGEADIEDRRFYFSAASQALHLSEFRTQRALKVRAGISAYLAEYNEPAAWGIFQYEWKPGSDVRHEFTPLMRVFYKNVLLEAGSSIKGDWLLNLMIHY